MGRRGGLKPSNVPAPIWVPNQVAPTFQAELSHWLRVLIHSNRRAAGAISRQRRRPGVGRSGLRARAGAGGCPPAPAGRPAPGPAELARPQGRAGPRGPGGAARTPAGQAGGRGRALRPLRGARGRRWPAQRCLPTPEALTPSAGREARKEGPGGDRRKILTRRPAPRLRGCRGDSASHQTRNFSDTCRRVPRGFRRLESPSGKGLVKQICPQAHAEVLRHTRGQEATAGPPGKLVGITGKRALPPEGFPRARPSA